MNHFGLTSDSMVRSSPEAAWPETCTAYAGGEITSTPIRERPSMTRRTADSLPGMGVAEKTTVSFSASLMCLCSRTAIRLRADRGSPWDPVQTMITFAAGFLPASSTETTTPGGTSR